MGLQKKLPYLNAYLQNMQGEKPIARTLSPSWYLPMLMAMPLALVAGTASNSQWGIWVMPSWGLIMGGLALYNHRQSKPRTPQERFRVKAFETLVKFQARSGPRRLRKSLHPAAAQVLEACAFYHNRVLAVLDAPGWQELAESDHWEQVRAEARNAADTAMLEALVCADPYLGNEQARTFDFSKVIKEFASGDVEDAFGELSRILGWERDEDFNHWDAIPEQLHPAYNVATKLKKLVGELEKQAADLERQSTVAGGSASLDNVLRNLEQLRTAEQELEAEDPLRQRISGR